MPGDHPEVPAEGFVREDAEARRKLEAGLAGLASRFRLSDLEKITGEIPGGSMAERDRLAEAFMKQNLLQILIYGPRFRKDMAEREIEALAITYLLHLQGETAQAMRNVRIDPAWSKIEVPDLDGLRREVVDAFHIVLNLGLLLWGDSEAFFVDYVAKWKENFERAHAKSDRKVSLLPPAEFRNG